MVSSLDQIIVSNKEITGNMRDRVYFDEELEASGKTKFTFFFNVLHSL